MSKIRPGQSDRAGPCKRKKKGIMPATALPKPSRFARLRRRLTDEEYLAVYPMKERLRVAAPFVGAFFAWIVLGWFILPALDPTARAFVYGLLAGVVLMSYVMTYFIAKRVKEVHAAYKKRDDEVTERLLERSATARAEHEAWLANFRAERADLDDVERRS